MTTDPMQEVRADIDRIDREIMRLLAERRGRIERAVAIKREHGLPARIVARVDEVMANATANARDCGVDTELAAGIWRMLVEWSIAYENRHLQQGSRDRKK